MRSDDGTDFRDGFGRAGVRQLFFGEGDNELRNQAKKQALSLASGTVALIAHTGRAYLDPDANTHFYSALVDFLERGPDNRLLVILLNPFASGAVPLYLNWLRCYRATEHPADEQVEIMAQRACALPRYFTVEFSD